jgi:hypothetical protein
MWCPIAADKAGRIEIEAEIIVPVFDVLETGGQPISH